MLAFIFQRAYWVQTRFLRPKTLQELDTIVSGSPNNAVAQFYLGVRRYEAEDIVGANRCFAKVVLLNPSWDIGHYNAGMTLFRLSRFKEAQRQFELALRENMSMPQATFMLGYSFVGQGKFGEGFELMRQAIRQNPQEITFQWSLGYNLLRVNQWGEAIPVLKQVVPLRQNDPKVQSALGEAFLLQGEVAEAKRYLDRALQLDKGSLTLLALRNACDISANATPEALVKIGETLQKALQSSEDSQEQLWFYAGQVFRQREQPREALQAYRNALHAGYSNDVLFFGLAEMAERLGKVRDAKTYRDEYERLQALRVQLPLLSQYVLREKDDADAHLALARAYRAFQFRQRAMTEYDAYLKLRKEDVRIAQERNNYLQYMQEVLRRYAPASVLPSLLYG